MHRNPYFRQNETAGLSNTVFVITLIWIKTKIIKHR